MDQRAPEVPTFSTFFSTFKKDHTVTPSHTIQDGPAHGLDPGASQRHLEAASTSPLAAFGAFGSTGSAPVLQWHAAHPWSMIRSSTSAASPASPASLHGSSPPSLMFSSLQLPRERVTAELELSCSILSTRESDPTNSVGSVKERALRRWLQSSDSRRRYSAVTLQHQRHDRIATGAFS